MISEFEKHFFEVFKIKPKKHVYTFGFPCDCYKDLVKVEKHYPEITDEILLKLGIIIFKLVPQEFKADREAILNLCIFYSKKIYKEVRNVFKVTK